MTGALLELGDWLAPGFGASRVVLEATSDTWRAPVYLLDGRFETWLVNAKDVKHLPGRPKTDLFIELRAALPGSGTRCAHHGRHDAGSVVRDLGGGCRATFGGPRASRFADAGIGWSLATAWWFG
ncbi:MAG: hypothetical protein ACYDAQ_00090 [Mycobacteriales bacterium]